MVGKPPRGRIKVVEKYAISVGSTAVLQRDPPIHTTWVCLEIGLL